MKRMIMLFLLIALFSSAYATESADAFYIEKGTCFLNENGIVLTINGDPTSQTNWKGAQLVIPIIIENNSDKNIAVFIENSSINRWVCESDLSGNVPAGKKKKSEISFSMEDADISAVSEVEEIEFSIYAYDNNNWFGDKVLPATPPIKLMLPPEEPVETLNENADDQQKTAGESITPQDERVDPHLLEILKTGSTQYTQEEITGGFNPSSLVWNNKRITLSETEWRSVQNLFCNLYYDEGTGYIDLGYDNLFTVENNDLVYDFDGTWLSINRQPVAFYYFNTWEDGDQYIIRGYTPCIYKGNEMYIIIEFSDTVPDGYLAGAVSDIPDPEIKDIDDKAITAIRAEDQIQFLCHFIAYDGLESGTYKLGDKITIGESIEIANTYVNMEKVKMTYCFVDTNGNRYWTPLLTD